MNLKCRYKQLFIIIAVFIACSCISSDKSPSADQITPEVLSKPELLIDFEQGGIIQPSSIVMLSDTQIALLDKKLQEVFIFNSQGVLKERFGGKGKGPGEFVSPQYIDKSPKHINVIDAELYRLSRFSYYGEFEESFSFKENPFNSTISVVGDGMYFVGSMGEKGSLIKLVDSKADTSILFGKAPGKEVTTVRLEKARQTLAGGEIPEMYKNQLTLRYEDNHLYVFLEAYSRIQKYSRDGRLLWEKAVDLPINKLIFQRAVERAKKAPADVLPSYQYITSMKVIEGDLFLLWMPVENHLRKLVRITEDGAIANIYHIPEDKPTFFDFTINPSENKLYLSAPQLGQVYQTDFQL